MKLNTVYGLYLLEAHTCTYILNQMSLFNKHLNSLQMYEHCLLLSVTRRSRSDVSQSFSHDKDYHYDSNVDDDEHDDDQHDDDQDDEIIKMMMIR